jgi:N-acetylglutamate synthase-like GNAT family acetyltransferase
VSEALALDIRPASPDDMPQVYALREEVLGSAVEVTPNEGAIVLVASMDEGVVATGQVNVREGEEHAEVKRVAVHPLWQGHGIGAKLLASLEGEAIQAGAEATELESRTTVEGFYSNRGYTRIGAPVVGRVGVKVRMRKELPDDREEK